MFKKMLLLVLLLAVSGSVNAALTYLPDSSVWEGYTYYEGDENMSVRLEYAVYDLEDDDDVDALDTLDSSITSLGEGQYVYIYQLFTNDETGYLAVESFELLGFDTSVISDISSIDDDSGVSVDSDGLTDSGSSITWMFESVTLGDGTQSYYLVFTSDASPVAGDYELISKTSVVVPGTDDSDDSGTEVPEPATVALFGLGMTAVMRKVRRRK